MAWGCVQLYCDQLLCKPALNSTNNEEIENPPSSLNKTSVQQAKQAIFSSKPNIIFCDIFLKSYEVLQFDHLIELPMHLPPSFKVSNLII